MYQKLNIVYYMKISEKLSRKIGFAYVLLKFLWLLTTKVSHGSVATQLWCGRTFNNQMTATCPQSLPMKKFCKSVNIWRRYGQSQSGTFYEKQYSTCNNGLRIFISHAYIFTFYLLTLLPCFIGKFCRKDCLVIRFWQCSHYCNCTETMTEKITEKFKCNMLTKIAK